MSNSLDLAVTDPSVTLPHFEPAVIHPRSTPSLRTTAIEPQRFARAKRSYNTRRVPLERLNGLSYCGAGPHVGDLVLAKVAKIGQHKRLHLPSARRATLYEGDEIVVVYGERYAPNQFEAYLPEDLGPCHLVAAGGIAGRVESAHLEMDEPTVIEPLGLVADRRGEVVNIRDHALRNRFAELELPPLVFVFGTTMDSGKTTTAASVVRGLSQSGLEVGAAKVTGTGSSNDTMVYTDVGAAEVLDFVDAGWPTTFGAPMQEIHRITETLIGELTLRGADAIVVEVADGLFQDETAQLAGSHWFQSLGASVVFAAGDALGASAGLTRLRQLGVEPVAISGLLTASPLTQRETAGCVDVPVYNRDQLSVGGCALKLIERAG